MESKELYSRYKRVLVICKKKCSNLNLKTLFSKIVDKNEFMKCLSSLTIFVSTVKLLKNYNHKNQAIILERALLKQVDSHLEYDNDEIVIPMFELEEDIAKIYTLTYSDTMAYKDFFNLRKVQDYFNSSSNFNTSRVTKLVVEFKFKF